MQRGLHSVHESKGGSGLGSINHCMTIRCSGNERGKGDAGVEPHVPVYADARTLLPLLPLHSDEPGCMPLALFPSAYSPVLICTHQLLCTRSQFHLISETNFCSELATSAAIASCAEVVIAVENLHPAVADFAAHDGFSFPSSFGVDTGASLLGAAPEDLPVPPSPRADTLLAIVGVSEHALGDFACLPQSLSLGDGGEHLLKEVGVLLLLAEALSVTSSSEEESGEGDEEKASHYAVRNRRKWVRQPEWGGPKVRHSNESAVATEVTVCVRGA